MSGRPGLPGIAAAATVAANGLLSTWGFKCLLYFVIIVVFLHKGVEGKRMPIEKVFSLCHEPQRYVKDKSYPEVFSAFHSIITVIIVFCKIICCFSFCFITEYFFCFRRSTDTPTVSWGVCYISATSFLLPKTCTRVQCSRLSI